MRLAVSSPISIVGNVAFVLRSDRHHQKVASRLLTGAVLSMMLLAACGEPATTPASSTTTTVSAATATSPTTSTTSSTTTTTVPSTRPILQTTRFAPNIRYRGVLPQLDVEYEFEFQLDGWRVERITRRLGDAIHIWNWQQDLPTGAEAYLVLSGSNLSIGDIANEYATHPEVAEAGEPFRTTLADHPAYQVDLLMQAADEPAPIDACEGRPITQEGIWLSACTQVRLWVVDVDGIAVIVWVAAAFEDLSEGGIAGDGEGNLLPDMVWQFEDFQPLIDDFVNALSFCTDLTPCDNN